MSCGGFFFVVFLVWVFLLHLLGTSHYVSDSFQESNFLVLRSEALKVLVGVEGPIPRCFVKISSGIYKTVRVAKLQSRAEEFSG